MRDVVEAAEPEDAERRVRVLDQRGRDRSDRAIAPGDDDVAPTVRRLARERSGVVGVRQDAELDLEAVIDERGCQGFGAQRAPGRPQAEGRSPACDRQSG